MSTYKEIFGRPIKVLTGDPAPTPISFTVTDSGGAFYIDGVKQKTLELYEGNTYIFTYPSAHPFRFATAADAAGSTEYTTGVTVDSSTQITIVVASGAPTLFYYCTNHNNMGGTILTPANISEYEGQIWYNETTGKFRSIVALESITSQTPLSTARSGQAGVGSTTAALVFGGTQSPPITGATEEFNGSGFTTGGTLNNARQELGGAGTQTAGLGFGGYNSPGGSKDFSEEYDGSSWTEGDNLGTARYRVSGIGTQTAALACAGRVGSGPSPGAVQSLVEDYNGTSWTSGTALNTARQSAGGAGTNTAGLICGGGASPATTNTANSEEWNGSSWSEGNNLPTATRAFAGQNGLQTAAIMMGGAPNITTIQTYDGTSWATSPATLATARHNGGGTTGQPGTAGMSFGGYDPGSVTGTTEEYNKSVNVFTAAAFASGGVYPAQYYGLGSSTNGTQNAALGFAGNYPGGYTGNTTTNEYDGSAWTAKPAMSTARAYLAGFGTSTAAVGVGGLVPPGATGSNAVEEFTGSWTAGNTIPQAGWNQGACGTLTAGFVAFGTNPTYPGQYAKAFEYDGTNWTAANDAPQVSNDTKGMGVQTSALFAGGGPPSAKAKVSYEYDGTNWTAGGALSSEHKAGVTLGSSKDAGIIGGGHTSPQTAVEGYDGTAWSSRPSMATSRGRGGMSGTESSGVVFGGNPSATNATEEWTAETFVLNTKNISTS